MHSATHDAIAAVWRIESARIVAVVARMLRDIGQAEEAAQDALVAALEHWPRDGVPANPGAWLMTTAKHRALDLLRRHKVQDSALEQIGLDLEAREALVVPDFVDALDAARQVFSDRESAALAYVEEATRHRKVANATFEALCKHFSDREIVEITHAKRDQDHLPIVVCDIPQIPDRSRAIVGRGVSPLRALRRGPRCWKRPAAATWRSPATRRITGTRS